MRRTASESEAAKARARLKAAEEAVRLLAPR